MYIIYVQNICANICAYVHIYVTRLLFIFYINTKKTKKTKNFFNLCVHLYVQAVVSFFFNSLKK
ncbi:hypothetical protein [Plasmodium yoelii yoelii]|uniref:Uncharacterized protein n=1 Tax=Plasmodium yoelii yoelii TaxID=73239 RepID=Q7RLT0_PLAYO|nr:hypothetical protein [Plasmodium yoelii yoelii]